MAKRDQLEFFKMQSRNHFGGSKLKSNPKTARPLSTKQAIHLILKSAHTAYGPLSLLHSKNVDKIHNLVTRQAKHCGVRIYRFVNVGNHLHLVVKIQSRALFKSFLRAVTGLIARHALRAERNHAKAVSFWEARPFTRLIAWGSDYGNVERYIEINRWQARVREVYVRWGVEIFSEGRLDSA